jgi:Asp-tRNA(Asn)/Glu-tRNA(Gln) amidotransferase A subunit family amidase
MMSGEIQALTATRARRAIGAGELAPTDLLAACRARIAERDGMIGAFARLAPDAPIRPAGALAGIPVAVKDIVDTAGLGTEYGSALFAGHVPERDADCVRRLKAAGAIVIGKTVTTEFAHTTPKHTRNPRDERRTPGGSSSGSAAAVADAMAPLAIGTQTGGSVIRPASFCGVFGFKSSIGRTRTEGIHELARSLDTVGWFARSAADLQLLGAVLLEPPRKPTPRPARWRLAFLATPYDADAQACAREACDAVRRKLSGVADVADLALAPRYGALNALHRRIVSVEASRAFAPYEGRDAAKLSPALREFIALGRSNEMGYAAAQAEAEAARLAFDADIAPFDALVLPAALGEAPLGLETTGEATYSLFLSLLGPPCATLPAAQGPSGLPVGVQFVGARGRDEELLDLLRWAAAMLDLATE